MAANKASAKATVSTTTVTGFLDRTTHIAGVSYPYQLYIPRSYDPQHPAPVILFLHGAGERGSDGLLQTEVGLGTALRRFPERFHALVVFPQAPVQSRWEGVAADAALAALDETIAAYNIDQQRVYLTGLSMGGAGSWYIAYHHHKRFAALLNICGFVGDRGPMQTAIPDGRGTPYDRLAKKIKGLPTWIVHGEADVLVSVEESRRIAAALAKQGSPVTYTELPGINHNSWDAAYQSRQIAEWLMAQRRKP